MGKQLLKTFPKIGFRKKALSMKQKEAIAGYLIIMPWIVGFLVFSFGPVIASFVLMFTKWELITAPQWIQFDNFTRLIKDPLVPKSLYNTFIYTIFSVPLNLLAALCTAMLLNVKSKASNLFRTLIYLPSQMPAAATAILWFFIFSPTYGLANSVLGWFGIEEQKWLWDIHLVKPALIIMSIWNLGVPMIIFLAALQGVPDQLYEAAILDGAGKWKKLFFITLPLISPTILFNLVIGLIGSFQVFTQVFIMTGGGPGNASLMYVMHIYNNAFANFRMGYASLLAGVLFILVMLLTYLQFKMSKAWVYYEGGN